MVNVCLLLCYTASIEEWRHSDWTRRGIGGEKISRLLAGEFQLGLF